MEQGLHIRAVPDETASPAQAAGALEAGVRQVNGVRAITHRIDACAGVADVEAIVHIDALVGLGESREAIEARLLFELERHALVIALTVQLESDEPPGSRSGAFIAVTGASRARARDALSLGLRAEVRRLVELVPVGRVTTVTSLGEWIAVETDEVVRAYEGLIAERQLPWHRVSDRNGQLDTLQCGQRLRAHAARLEAEHVPVRYARIVGVRSLLYRRDAPLSASGDARVASERPGETWPRARPVERRRPHGFASRRGRSRRLLAAWGRSAMRAALAGGQKIRPDTPVVTAIAADEQLGLAVDVVAREQPLAESFDVGAEALVVCALSSRRQQVEHKGFGC